MANNDKEFIEKILLLIKDKILYERIKINLKIKKNSLIKGEEIENLI